MPHPKRPPKPCKECGELFWAPSRKTERCSLECARTYRKRRTREREQKPCGKCRKVLPLAEFGMQNRRGLPTPRSYCPECERERQKQQWAEVDLKRKFGLSGEQYDAILRAQGGGCAMCQKKPGSRRLHVDHDHACCPDYRSTCGKCVRGILCKSCNTALGHLRDNVDTLRRGIMYLTNPPALDAVEQGFADGVG